MAESQIITQWGASFLKGTWRYIRQTFSGVGQDSFTQAPSQNEDMFQAATNVLPPLDGGWRPRWGYTFFTQMASSAGASLQSTPPFLYQSDLLNFRRFVVPNLNGVPVFDEAGNQSVASLFTPAAQPRMLTSRSYGYFASGVQADLLKWDGSSAGVMTNWGIQAPASANAIQPSPAPPSQVTGYAGTGANKSLGEGANFNWQVPANATGAPDGNLSKARCHITNELDLTNYSLAVPADVSVTGLQVNLAFSWLQVKNGTLNVALINNGVRISPPIQYQMADGNGSFLGTSSINIDFTQVAASVSGTALYTTATPTTLLASGDTVVVTGFTNASNNGTFIISQITTNTLTLINGSAVAEVNPLGLGVVAASNGLAFGGMGNLWTVNLTSEICNSTSFGVAIWAAGTSLATGFFDNIINNNIAVDSAQIIVFFTAPIGTATGGPGAITLVSGRIYYQVYMNSTTGQISDLSLPTASTGPLTDQLVNLTGLSVSPDPQVDTAIILATPDGGDEEQLYYVGQVANGVTTFQDNTPEPTLITNNVYLELDSNGDELGVSFNDPPPADLRFPLKHRGRVYGISGAKNLFFTKSEAELYTSSGLLVGRFEECWPPLNFLDISEGAEEILGLLSDGQVLYIGTERQVIRLFGDGPDTYLQPEALFVDVGVLNQDVWQMVFLEGNPIGAMWLTHDLRVVGSDFNTYQDIGLPIQDMLNSINVSVAQQACWASYMALGQFNLFVLAVPTGSATQPNTLLVFDLKVRQWFVWNLADVVVGGTFNIALAGNQPQCLLINPQGAAFTFTPGQFSDRINYPSFNPTPFPITLQTSFTPLGDPAARKLLNEIEVQTGATDMLVTVAGASTTAEFASPNIVLANAPLITKPRGELGVFLASSVSKDRYYQFTFQSTSSGFNYLRGYNVEGIVIHRV